MKKLLLAAAIIVPAIAGTAQASEVLTKFNCDMISGIGHTEEIAKKCNDFIVGIGVISSGKHEGKTWGEAYSYNFKSPTDANVRLKKHHVGLKIKYSWEVDGRTYRTKNLDKNAARKVLRDNNLVRTDDHVVKDRFKIIVND